MKYLKILLIVIAVVSIGIAVSYPIRYQQALESNNSELEELSAMRRRAQEEAATEAPQADVDNSGSEAAPGPSKEAEVTAAETPASTEEPSQEPAPTQRGESAPEATAMPEATPVSTEIPTTAVPEAMVQAADVEETKEPENTTQQPAVTQLPQATENTEGEPAEDPTTVPLTRPPITDQETTQAPTEAPTELPAQATEAPTEEPTQAPTELPAQASEAPAEAPTELAAQATEAPAEEPTQAPTEAPAQATEVPIEEPTLAPTEVPAQATMEPTPAPTEAVEEPTAAPTENPDPAGMLLVTAQAQTSAPEEGTRAEQAQPQAPTAKPVVTAAPQATAVPATATPEPQATEVPATATPQPQRTEQPMGVPMLVTPQPTEAPTPEATPVSMPQAEAREVTPIPVVTAAPLVTPEPTLSIDELILNDVDFPTPTPPPYATATPVPTAPPTPVPDRNVRNYGIAYPNKEKVELDEAKILPELKEIYELNHDLVGWLYIADTVIDYPVVQSDDTEFYMTHDFYGNSNSNGQCILYPTCDPWTPSYNLVISAHHMRSGAMFGNLPKYKDKNYWETHKIVEFDTLMERKKYVIFAVFYSADYDEDEEGFRYQVDIQYKIDADHWLEEIEENELYDTGIDAVFGDEFLLLTTCDRSRHRDGRFVAVARRIREGENIQ